jgi:Dehydrogenases with different specificities (related to short-chain alcohol dehydrogenases)
LARRRQLCAAADAAEAVVRDIEGAGGSALALQGDVAREEDVLATFGEIDRRFGRIDGLVNNAGIVGKLGRLDRSRRPISGGSSRSIPSAPSSARGRR